MAEVSGGGGPPRWVWWAAGGGGALLLVLFLTLNGGDDSADDPTNTTTDTQASSEDLNRQLQATLAGLAPENLNVSRDSKSLVDDLNIWWLDAHELHPLPSATEEAATLGEYLGQDAQDHSTAPQFSLRDTGHVRNALLFRSIAEAVVQTAETDLARAVAAFDLVSRQMTPVVGSNARAPRTTFETLVYGRGRPEDRAWAFAEILRQLRIDCVMLSPRAGETEPQPRWLIGVIIPDAGVYLFDPELRLPIPAASGNEHADLVDQPATLSEALANDEVLRQLDAPRQSYPLTSAQLASCDVEAVTQSGFSAARMYALQSSLPAEFRAILFDGLVSSSEEEQPGLLERIRTTEVLASREIGLWRYPEEQTSGFYAASGESSSELQSEIAVLRAPRILRRQKVGEDFVEVEVDSPRPLRFVRVEHLRGELTPALQHYGAIRSSASLNVSSINLEGSEFAAYWIAVCQYEMHRFPAALDNCELYRRLYPQGLWINPVREISALCHVREGRFAEAAGLLEEEPEPTLRDAYLIRHWRSRTEAAAGEPE